MDLGVSTTHIDPALIAQQPLSTRDRPNAGGRASQRIVDARPPCVSSATGFARATCWWSTTPRLIAARLHGRRPTGGAIEVLLVEPIDDDGGWRCIARGPVASPRARPSRFGVDMTGIWAIA